MRSESKNPRRYRHWDKDAVLAELGRRLSRDGVLSARKLQREDNGVYGAAVRYLGSWGKAMRALGVPYRAPAARQAWTRQRVLDRLLELQAAGVHLSSTAITKRDPALRFQINRFFGKIALARRAIGAGAAIEPATRWTAANVQDELRALREAGGPMNYRRMALRHPGLVDAAIRHWGSYRKALEAAGINYASVSLLRPRKRWDQAAVLDALRAWWIAKGNLSSNKIQREENSLYRAAVRHCGSWGNAMRALKRPYRERRQKRPWDRQRVLDALRELHDKGVRLSSIEISRRDAGLLTAVSRHVGTIQAAREAIGAGAFVPASVRWTAQKVADSLRQLHQSGEKMSSTHMMRNHGALAEAAIRHCGSFSRALACAGLDYQEVTGRRPTRRWDRAKVIAALKQRKAEVGDVYARRLQRQDMGLYHAAVTRFGSYTAALKAAGLTYRLERGKWTRQAIITELKRLHEMDADLRYKPLQRVHPGLPGACRHRFGSYQAAMGAAGLPYPPVKPAPGWKRSQILAALREMHDGGEDLRYSAVKNRHGPLFRAARQYFGSYIGAVACAGLNYDEIVQEGLKRQRRRS